MQFDDETLMAYADGALPADQAGQIAAALAADPALAARVQEFRAARAAIAALPLPAAPAGLEAHIRALAAAQAASKMTPQPADNVIPLRRRASASLWQIPLTAAAALVVGALLGPILMPPPSGDGLPVQLVQALDHQPSGAVQNGVTLIASFHDGAGTLCREYETASQTGIACRQDGAWQLRLAVASGGAGGYAPASGLEIIDTWMAQNDGGAPLSAEAEAEALKP